MRRKRRKMAIRILWMFAIILLFGFGTLVFAKEKPQRMGATFSTHYADELGIDWKDAFTESVQDLKIQHFRIPVYWSRVQENQDGYSWDELDWIMNQAEKNDLNITIAIGQKVPRWPECFIPEWAEELPEVEYRQSLSVFLQEVVYRYKDYESLERWQIENEAFFPFGDCPAPDVEQYRMTMDLVHSIDNETPIQVTTSGEQSIWIKSALESDIVGASLYREVKDPNLGNITFPHSPFYYRVQGVMARMFTEKIIISELQVEPWGIHMYLDSDQSVLNAYANFTKDDLTANVQFAKATRLDEVYLWGIEWWYALKENGENRLWDQGRNIIHQANMSYE